MREAIKQYVEREEARESFTAEALASWAAYQETGQHLTGQEVRVERRFAQLATAPDIGRPFPENQEFRELAIRFGDFGYVAPYRHDPADEAVYVRAFKHQREAGY
jgi:plasmid stabilization system protein ParE